MKNDQLNSAPSSPDKPPQTILLVEDVPATLYLSSLALRNAGYNVLEARDASMAQSIVRSGATIDLIVTDYLMPDMDGIELAQWFQRIRPSLKIVLISASPDNATFAGSFLPTVTCQAKPDAPEDMVGIVQEALADSAH